MIKTCRTIILHFVYADAKLGEERKLRVFENRALRKIFGHKRDDVTGEWRRLQNEQLHDLYSSPDIIRVIISRSTRLLGHVSLKGERRDAYRILVGKPEGKKKLLGETWAWMGR